MGKLLNLSEQTSLSIKRTTRIHLVNPVNGCLLSVYYARVLDVRGEENRHGSAPVEPTVWRGSRLPNKEAHGWVLDCNRREARKAAPGE